MRFAVASLLVLLFAAILLVSCGGGASQVSTPPPPPPPGGGANTLGSASSSPTTCPSSTANPDVVNASFTAVQIAFTAGSTGWLTGPAADGPLTLTCRWATTAQWIHDNVRQPSTAFCATGNSAGAGVIAYALARFGQGS